MFRSLAVIVLASAAVAAPVPKSVKAKSPDFTGTWEIVELRSGLQDVTALNPKVWVIEGNVITSYHRNKLDGKLNPWEPNMTLTLERPEGGGVDDIDYVRVGPNDNMRLKGVVRVTDDELTICYCFGGDRPTEVKASEKVSVERYKRVSGK